MQPESVAVRKRLTFLGSLKDALGPLTGAEGIDDEEIELGEVPSPTVGGEVEWSGVLVPESERVIGKWVALPAADS